MSHHSAEDEPAEFLTVDDVKPKVVVDSPELKRMESLICGLKTNERKAAELRADTATKVEN